MMSKIGSMIDRVVTSQKALMSFVGAGLTVFGYNAGMSEQVLTVVGSLFGVLVAIQGALDYKHGSPSDGTGEFKG